MIKLRLLVPFLRVSDETKEVSWLSTNVVGEKRFTH